MSGRLGSIWLGFLCVQPPSYSLSGNPSSLYHQLLKKIFLSVVFFVWTLEEDHFSQYLSLYQLLKKIISLSIFIVAVTIPVWIGGSVCMSVCLLQKHFRIWFYMFEFQLYSFLLLWKHWRLLIHHDPHRCTSGSWRLLWTHHQQILYKGNIFISKYKDLL